MFPSLLVNGRKAYTLTGETFASPKIRENLKFCVDKLSLEVRGNPSIKINYMANFFISRNKTCIRIHVYDWT